MPAALLAFFILMGAAHTDTLVRGDGAVLRGRDPNVGIKTHVTPVTYTATTAPWRGARADRKGGCDYQLLVRVTGRGPVRVRINTVEQLLDESWTPRFRLQGGKDGSFRVEFLEPAGPEVGYTITERKVTFKCRPRDNRPGYTIPDMSGVR